MPSRRTFALAALVVTIGAVYGSLVPFNFRPIDVGEAVARFRRIPLLTIGPSGRADWVSNILLFVPVAFLWMGALTLDIKRLWRRAVWAIGLIVALVALSIALEFTQMWFPPRTVSQNDIIAESLGAAAGAILWLAFGQTTTDWLRTVAAARRPRDRFVKLLELYAVGVLIYSVLPLDLTISSGDFMDKLRAGRLVLVPFSDVRLGAEGIYGLARDVVVFVPMGMLLGIWETRAAVRVRPIWLTAFLGLVAAALIEGLQVFVLSRYASATDVVFGTVGAAGGGALMVWLYAGRYGPDSVDRAGPVHRRALAWGAATCFAAVVIIVVFCAPFEVAGSSEDWRRRYEGIWAAPFARLYFSSEYNAVSDVLRKLLLFGALGAFGAKTAAAMRLPGRITGLLSAVVVLAGAGLSLGIEIAQVVLPPHVPDITDVILGGLGAAAGVAVVSFVTKRAPI